MFEPINHGTYWSAGELRKLKTLYQNGMALSDIAFILERTESACQARLFIIRTALLLDAVDNATIKSIQLLKEQS